LKKVFPGVFEQARVALATHYLVVNPSRFLARAHFADKLAVAVPDGKLRNRSSFGNREQVSAFEGSIGVVAKDLFDVCGRHLPADFSVYLNGLNGQCARQCDGLRRARAAVAGTRHDDALCLPDDAGHSHEQQE
jgi:hypothetical protein